VLYGRVSAQSQKDNQPDDLAILKMEVEKRDVPVIAVFWEIVPGWEEMYSDKWSRLEFERAILKAKAAGAVIAAASVDRFRRSWDPDWKKRKRQRRLSVFEIESLMTEADGVPLATLIHPDTAPNEVRSYQTKRGQAGKGNYGGRPAERFPKKAIRLEKKPEAIALWKQGFSYRRIGRLWNVTRSTIRDWTKNVHQKPHTSALLANHD